MKAFFAAALLCASPLCLAADLTIQIDDVRSADGRLMVALYSADNFLKKPFKVAAARATAGATTVLIKDVPAGEYAFAIYHDANGNGSMDKNAIGIPTEDYAFSNNAMGSMGPPSFDSARFALPDTGATARVTLK